MRRRVEDINGRIEPSSGNSALPVSANTTVGHGSSSPVSFVCLPTTTHSRLASPVAAIPITTTAALSIHEQVVHGGYVPGRIEMHPISAFSTNISVSPSNMQSAATVDGARSVISTTARGDTSSTASTQQSPPIRQRVLSNSVITHQVVSTPTGNAATVAACATLNSQIAGQFQRLKVEDALSYLDKVKLRFGRQPQVYNDFLDIMKEFKSQSIDTPGVIARVSQLFRGHPELIVGFNTFLPPGYKIEVQANETVSVSVPGQQTTVVHTPQGIQHHFTTTTTPQSTPPLPGRQIITPIKPAPANSPPTVRQSSMAVVPSVSSGTTIVLPITPAQVPNIVSTCISTVSSNSVPVVTALASGSSSTSTSVHSSVDMATAALRIGLPPQQTPQPVEFNHAINYVNKIKSRFSDQPDIYKQFLDILHTYQKEQKYMKEGGSIPRSLTDAEVYERVAKLFKNESDLLEEFSQFLPDAMNNTAQAAVCDIMDQYKHVASKSSLTELKKTVCEASEVDTSVVAEPSTSGLNQPSTSYVCQSNKKTRPGDVSSLPPAKRIRQNIRDGSLAEVGKQMTLSEYAFFDKVRKALRSESAYQNFVRCIDIYTHSAISKIDLLSLVNPFLSKFPDLHKWFVDFVGAEDAQPPIAETSQLSSKQERIGGDLAMEIDYNTCKRLGASYCALPKSFQQPECSGRTNLCKEVLNDTWVSFPSWSEDSTFVTSKKTQFEEYIYRCEDERFELDMVMETNTATIKLLSCIERTMEKMNSKDAHAYTLNENLNGTAITVYKRAISRIYGDKADDIIVGLRKNPVVAVPLVLRRLKSKDSDWREALKGFNKTWRDINEKYYLKSLDPQGISFKQTDMKFLRSKSLINEVETLYDERHERSEDGGRMETGPHLKLPYTERSVMDDAANLIIHHVRRQTAIHKDDKVKIKQLVRHFIPDLVFHTRLELSDDERDLEEDDEQQMDIDSDTSTKEKKVDGPTIVNEENGNNSNGSTSTTGSCKRKTRSNKSCSKLITSSMNTSISRQNSTEVEIKAEEDLPAIFNGGEIVEEEEDIKPKVEPNFNGTIEQCHDLSNDDYKIFMCNNNWYLVLRLHHILCTRLLLMYETSLNIVASEIRDKKERTTSAAMALRLRPQYDVPPERIYTAMLDMVKNVLDGNLEIGIFEDRLREMFGIYAYKAFTLDKVVTNSVRQLQHIVCDEAPSQVTSMYIQESRKGATGGPSASAHRRFHDEQLYLKRAEKCLKDENCFKIVTLRKACELTIELIDPDAEDSEENGAVTPTNGLKEERANAITTAAAAAAEAQRLTDYLDRYLSSSPQLSPSVLAKLSKKPVFLPRNIRTCMKKSSIGDTHMEDDTQCRFNLSNFKMVFVVNSDSCIFKKAAFYKARKSHKAVSKRMKSGFSKWHNKWCEINVNGEEKKETNSWFAGEIDGLRPNKTILNKIVAVDRPPYQTYNKYTSEKCS